MNDVKNRFTYHWVNLYPTRWIQWFGRNDQVFKGGLELSLEDLSKNPGIEVGRFCIARITGDRSKMTIYAEGEAIEMAKIVAVKIGQDFGFILEKNLGGRPPNEGYDKSFQHMLKTGCSVDTAYSYWEENYPEEASMFSYVDNKKNFVKAMNYRKSKRKTEIKSKRNPKI